MRRLALVLLPLFAAPAAAQDSAHWIERLIKDEYIFEAVRGLEKLGPAAGLAVVAEYRDPNTQIQSNRAAIALRHIGRKHPLAFHRLLRDRDDQARGFALDVYCSLKPSPAAARALIVPLLAEETPDRRRLLLMGLCNGGVHIPEMVSYLIDALRNEASDWRQVAAYHLGSYEVDAERVVPALVEASRAKEASVRDAALYGLGRMSDVSDEARRIVIGAGEPKERGAVFALTFVEDADMTPVVKALGGKHAWAAQWGLRMRWLERGVPVGKERAAVFASRDDRLLYNACKAIAREDSRAKPDLLALLRDKHRALVKTALRTIERIGDDSEPVRKALLRLHAEGHRDLRREAAHVMVRMGIEVDAMLRWFSGELPNSARKDPYVALHNFTRLGPVGKRAAEKLRGYLDGDYRFEAERALWSVGGGAAAGVKTLAKNLKEDAHNEEALRLAGELGPAAKELVPLILPALKGEEVHHAALALARIGDKRAVPALIQAMVHEEKLGREAAAGALYRLQGGKGLHARASAILLGVAIELEGGDDDVWPYQVFALRHSREKGYPNEDENRILVQGAKETLFGVEWIRAVGERGGPGARDALWEIAHSYRPHTMRAAALEALRRLDAKDAPSRPAGK